MEKTKILVIAGERSGDERAASVVAALKLAQPESVFRGMGGPALREAGVEIIVDIGTLHPVMGISESLAMIPQLKNAFQGVVRLLDAWKPELAILVDFPTFNLRFARECRSRNIPVLYYVAPKVWATRPGRVAALTQNVSEVASIFPFERSFLKKRGFTRCTYVGHPFNDEIKEIAAKEREEKQDALKSRLGISKESKIVALFPGSRKQEVISHLMPIIEGLEELRAGGLDVHGVVPLSPNFLEEYYGEFRRRYTFLHPWIDDPREVLMAADCGALKSGTCNLEAAFCGLPFVMLYQVAPLTALAIKRASLLKEYSIVNVIEGGSVKELLQEKVTGKEIAREVKRLLFDEEERIRVQAKLQRVREALRVVDSSETEGKSTTASARVANLALRLLRHPIKLISVWSRLRTHLYRHKGRLFAASLAMVLFGASDGLVPFLAKFALDRVFSENNQGYLLLFPLLLIALACVRAAADFAQHYLMSSSGHLITRDLRNELQQRILTLSPSYFHQATSGDLISRATSDVMLVRSLLTEGMSALVRDTIRIIALTIAAFVLDPWLALLAVVIFPLGVLPVMSFGKKLRRLVRRGQESVGSLSALLAESISGNKVVKIFCAEKYELARFRLENERLTKTLIRSERTRGLVGPINEILASLAIAAIVFIGGSSVFAATRSKGDFIAFVVAVFLMYDPFKKLSRLSGALNQGFAGASRIFEVLDEEPSVKEVGNPVELPTGNEIIFKEVSFAYRDLGEYALREIDLTIKEGEKIALVGFSGAGKSTLVDLVPRFIDPTSGEITIGGVNIANVRLYDLRQRVAMVGQNTFLFNDTIANNIAYGRRGPNATKSTLDLQMEIEKAAIRAQAFDFIQRLPQKFDTVVGEGGLTLSGGERQRLAIARAILSDAPILILDEATAALDYVSEREVQLALNELTRGRTTITIAHRLATVRDADRILMISEGRIVESGSHDELLRRGGEYARLYRSQFANSEDREIVAAVV